MPALNLWEAKTELGAPVVLTKWHQIARVVAPGKFNRTEHRTAAVDIDLVQALVVFERFWD